MRQILANFVRILHIALIFFIILVPFKKDLNWSTVLLHFTVCASLLFHWWCMNDECLLTHIESRLRGIPIDHSFMYSLVSPVYKISDENLRKIAFIVTPILGLVTFKRFIKRFPSFKDEFFAVFTLQNVNGLTII